MRGKKSYNIRNIEAHLTSLQNTFKQPIFQTNIVQPSEQQRQNEYINAKYGVSRYTSNMVSGKMFKKL
jgi:hypothetical protein